MLAKLCQSNFEAKNGESRIQYFYRWLRWAKYITLYQIQEEDTIRNLIKHFPQEHMFLVAAANRRSFEEILKEANLRNPIERVHFNIPREDTRDISYFNRNNPQRTPTNQRNTATTNRRIDPPRNTNRTGN